MTGAQRKYPDIFVSGLRTEFSDLRNELKRFMLDYMDIDINIFEALQVPGAETTIEETLV